jgi:hypothetical protein
MVNHQCAQHHTLYLKRLWWNMSYGGINRLGGLSSCLLGIIIRHVMLFSLMTQPNKG